MNEHQTIETRFYNRTGQTLKTPIEEMGANYHYRPSRFLTQFNWIEETFYSTTGSGKANRLYQRFADWLSNEGGFQAVCDWLHKIDITKYDFRSAPMTKDKEYTTVYETRVEGHMTRAVFELTELTDTPFLFIAAEVSGYFKLPDGDGRAALRQAGYQTTQRSHKGRKARYWAHPKHQQKTDCTFSLRTPNSYSCPTVRDAPDIALVKQ